jgi:hypothetical protein
MSLIYEALRKDVNRDTHANVYHASSWKSARAKVDASSHQIVIKKSSLFAWILLALAITGATAYFAAALYATPNAISRPEQNKSEVSLKDAPLPSASIQAVNKASNKDEEKPIAKFKPEQAQETGSIPKYVPLANAKESVMPPKARLENAVPISKPSNDNKPQIGQPSVAAALPEAPRLVSSAAVVAKPEPQPVANTEVLNLADVFEALNRELGKPDKSEAQIHLKKIQNALPASSIARLRAEAWFEYQQGRMEAARVIYQKILARLPGDEQASTVLHVLSQSAVKSASPK